MGVNTLGRFCNFLKLDLSHCKMSVTARTLEGLFVCLFFFFCCTDVNVLLTANSYFWSLKKFCWSETKRHRVCCHRETSHLRSWIFLEISLHTVLCLTVYVANKTLVYIYFFFFFKQISNGALPCPGGVRHTAIVSADRTLCSARPILSFPARDLSVTTTRTNT